MDRSIYKGQHKPLNGGFKMERVEDAAPSTKPLVLFCGLYAPTYNSDGIARAFADNGYEVSIFDWQRLRFDVGPDGMKERLLTKAKMERPDLIFLHIQTPDNLDVETAAGLQSIAPTVQFTFDVRDDIRWYKEIAPHITLTLFGDLDSVDECRREGILNVGYLQSSADYDWYKRMNVPVNEKAFPARDIVFIGNNFLNTNLNFPGAKQRSEMVEFMKDNFGDRFHVYGTGWRYSKMIHPQQEILVYNTCKVAITHNNYIRRGYTSDRLWRAMGCGAFTVSHYYPFINNDFNAGAISTWLHFDMLKDEVEKALANEPYRTKVAESGYELVRQNHSWTVRVKQLKNMINAILAK